MRGSHANLQLLSFRCLHRRDFSTRRAAWEMTWTFQGSSLVTLGPVANESSFLSPSSMARPNVSLWHPGHFDWGRSPANLIRCSWTSRSSRCSVSVDIEGILQSVGGGRNLLANLCLEVAESSWLRFIERLWRQQVASTVARLKLQREGSALQGIFAQPSYAVQGLRFNPGLRRSISNNQVADTY
jgi:hypothetical protein